MKEEKKRQRKENRILVVDTVGRSLPGVFVLPSLRRTAYWLHFGPVNVGHFEGLDETLAVAR